MLDFRIQSFLAVCKHLNYTKAAQELNLTQPAITQHIQYLQQHYQVKFFTRENNQLMLTPEGELFRNSMVSFRQSVHKLEEDFMNLSMNQFMIHFGCVLGVAEEDIPKNMAIYVRAHPDRNIQMSVNTTSELLKELDAGNLHFAVVEDTGFDKSGYVTIPWVSENFVCVCSKNRQVPEEPIHLKDLFHEPLIINSARICPDNMVLRSLQARNVTLSNFPHIYEVDNMSVVKQLLLHDIGIAFLPNKSVEKELASGDLKLIPVEDYNAIHTFLFIWRKNTIHDHLFRSMFTVLKTGNVDIDFETGENLKTEESKES